MYFSIIGGALWFAFSSLTFSAPLPLRPVSYGLSTTSPLREQPQIANQIIVPQTVSLSHDKTRAKTPTKKLAINKGAIQKGIDYMRKSAEFAEKMDWKTHSQEQEKPETSIENAKRELTEGEDKKTDHAKVKDDDQKEASGKSIVAAKAPAELLVEENKKEGEVHGGCRERAMAKPIARDVGGRARGSDSICN